jgi:uncharacterized protein YecE (DUF72 family)
MPVLVGTSGWQYSDWRGTFYPRDVPPRRWLGCYASHFQTVELNNAFYGLPESSVFASWKEQTPEGFVMAVKASRYLTHIRRLREPAEPVARLLERAHFLGPKLGPILLQLPPTLKKDVQSLDATLACFPPEIRVAVEPRHGSWFTDEVAEVLSRHQAALCLADRPGLRAPRWKTADWGYVRFHEGRATPHPSYGYAALRTWASRLADMYGDKAAVYAYFNNDTGACAPRNAETFARLLLAAGMPVEMGPAWRSRR